MVRDVPWFALALIMTAAIGFGIQAKAAQGTPEILKLYNRFIAARTIASRCMTVEPAMRHEHEAYLKVVERKARETFKERHPNLSNQAIDDRFDHITDQLETRILGALKQVGCDHPSTKKQLRAYREQALLNNPTGAGAANLRPIYGNVEKPAHLKAADEKFIRSVLAKGYTRESGSAAAVQRGWGYFGEGNHAAAMKRFNQGWLLDPENSDVYHGFAVLTATTNGAPADIERFFNLAISKARVNASAYVDFGWFLIEQKRFGDAERQLKAALANDSSVKNARRNLAILYGEQGDFESACSWVKDAQQMNDEVDPSLRKAVCSP